MAIMRYAEALRLAMTEEMERDPNVFVCGEEVAQYQGTFRVTEGMYQKFQKENHGLRVLDTPISEAGIVGLATGAAMSGLRPIAEFMTWSFALVAMDQIINHTAKIHYMSGGTCKVPVVLRGPAGAGNQLSAQHSQSLESWYAHIPGLKVVLPSTAADAKGLLKTAIRDDNPVIFMEHAGLYQQRGEVPEDPEFMIPFGVADIKRAGKDVTIISYSNQVRFCISAADKIAEETGIECEVIDLRTLIPLDMATVIRSVEKTHRAVVVHEEWKSVGFGAELASRIYEEAFDALDAPIERVGGPFVPMPYSKPLERAAIPHEEDIYAAIKRVIG